MKTKHDSISPGPVVIAGSVFYCPARKNESPVVPASPVIDQYRLTRKLREWMHPVKKK